MDIIEKQRVPGVKPSSHLKIETAGQIQAPGAPNSQSANPKSTAESKKTNEFAVVYFSKTTKPEAKSILVHNITEGSLEFIGNDPKLFRKYAKANAEMISHEVKNEREQKRFSEKHWENLQNAFHSRLKNLELQREKNHSS